MLAKAIIKYPTDSLPCLWKKQQDCIDFFITTSYSKLRNTVAEEA